MPIMIGDPPDDDGPVYVVLPKYCDLWNGDTKKPAGKLFFSPIGGSVNPATIGAGQSPFDVQPKNAREGKPKYDGVWFYDCSDISLPNIDITMDDIDMDAQALSTEGGTLGYTLKIIIKLIKKLTQIRPPCTDQQIEEGVETLRKLIKELSRIGITLKIAELTPEFIRTNFCSYVSNTGFKLKLLMYAIMELFPDEGNLPDFNRIREPWSRGPGLLRNCKWVFLGYYKRGKVPSGGGTAITPPSNPDPAGPNIIISVVPNSSNPEYTRPRVVGTADTSPPNKKYKLKNTKGLIELPTMAPVLLYHMGMDTVSPRIFTSWPE